MEIDTKEHEYKYNGNGVKLQDFLKLMNEVGFVKHLDTSSWDVYYTKETNPEEFQRFRQSDSPELTKKRKIKSSNNWERIEIDLPLDSKRVTEQLVSHYVALDGYKKNFKIYKSCFIYWTPLVNYVYYIVYDEDMAEQGRFIEVEVNKDASTSSERKFVLLKEAETKLSVLGISPQNRLKKSLFEMFVK